MSHAYITKRHLPSGEPRWIVRYRLGGRGFQLKHIGSFKLEREAKARLVFVRSELAAGRDPLETLRSLAIKELRRTGDEAALAYKASRVDLEAQTLRNLDSHLKRILATFGPRRLDEVSIADVQAWVNEQSEELKPGSLLRYMGTLRLLFDFEGIDPNPARDPRVKLPQVIREEPDPPSAEHVLAMLRIVPLNRVLPLIVTEQTGMRVGELRLTWADVDVQESRFRLRRLATKAKQARFIDVPRWLMDEIEETCPPEDRVGERAVFQGFTADVAKNIMARACKAAKIPHYHPHDLRHRRITLWHLQGVPARVVSDRAGHARTSMSLDVYSHVLLDAREITEAEFKAVLADRRRSAKRSAGAAPVRQIRSEV